MIQQFKYRKRKSWLPFQYKHQFILKYDAKHQDRVLDWLDEILKTGYRYDKHIWQTGVDNDGVKLLLHRVQTIYIKKDSAATLFKITWQP